VDKFYLKKPPIHLKTNIKHCTKVFLNLNNNLNQNIHSLLINSNSILIYLIKIKSSYSKLLLPRTSIDPYRHFESMFYIIIQSFLLLVFFFFPFYIIQGQNKYWHNRMCKGSFSTEDTEDYLPIETNMTLRSR